RIGRTCRPGPRTALRHVAHAGRRAADRRRRREPVCGTRIARAVARLGDVADARRRTAHRARAHLRVGRPRGRRARAGLRAVADDTKPQVAVQHEPDVPFAAPASHDSPESTVPLPQRVLYVTTAAAQFCAVDVMSAVCVPMALTTLYSESMVTWPADPPVLPE